MPEILTTSSRTAINSLLRFFSFCSFIFLFSFIMTHCKYYFEILFYVTFVFINEKKIYNKKMIVDLDPFHVTGFFQYPLTTKEARGINGLRSSCMHAQEKHIPLCILFLIIFNIK